MVVVTVSDGLLDTSWNEDERGCSLWMSVKELTYRVFTNCNQGGNLNIALNKPKVRFVLMQMVMVEYENILTG